MQTDQGATAPIPTTTQFGFCLCGNAMFTVNPGIPINEALQEAVNVLASASIVARYSDENSQLGCASSSLIEVATALIEASIKGLKGAQS